MEKVESAEKFLKEGRYQEAIKLFEEIHQAYPEEESTLLMLAWAHYDNGEASLAIEYLEILLDRELQRKVFTGFAYDELVRIYKKDRNFNGLIELCRRAAEIQPDNVGLLNELGNAYLQAGKAGEALIVYEKLIAIEDDNPAYYCYLGEALFACGRLLESEAAYLDAAAIDPEQADRYHFKLASLFQKTSNYPAAVKTLGKCIAFCPDKPIYHCCLGDALISLGEPEKARAAYEKAVQYDKSSAGAYYNRLGNALVRSKLFSQAAEAFQEAIKHDAMQQYYLSLASVYNALGLTDKAQETLSLIKKPNSKSRV
jgi:tetratricopeptide (TPR) repeat protein